MSEETGAAVLSPGERVHVAFRRLFVDDVRRHFVGEILGVSDDIVRAEGYAFVLNESTNRYERKPEKRIRVFSLSGHINLNVIPPNTDTAKVFYSKRDRELVVTDGGEFSLDVTEFGPRE